VIKQVQADIAHFQKLEEEQNLDWQLAHRNNEMLLELVMQEQNERDGIYNETGEHVRMEERKREELL
jgi:hypothetical protein